MLKIRFDVSQKLKNKTKSKMKYILLVILNLFAVNTSAQEKEVLNWINENAIEIEDADPNTGLPNFNKNIPASFKNVKIFGFGEASHHGKEFFDIKAKFFKYLVKTQNVKVFIMEESYFAEAGINEWISGGKGDAETIAHNFSILPWYNQEVVDLLGWMRSYNLSNPEEEKIRFYGMDIQYVKGINEEIRDYVRKYNVPVGDELLSEIDKAAQKKIDYENPTKWADIQLPKIQKVQNIIIDNHKSSDVKQDEEYTSILRVLEYLKKYTYYLQHPKSKVRDQKMFENVKWIIDNNTSNGKAFIWAHNEHINNKEISPYGSGWISVGGHLKDFYKEDYYSVYFDFGKGEVIGYVTRKNKPNYWDLYEIEKPFRKTYSETLNEANKDIYFIDMDKALKNIHMKNFFSDKKKQLLLGAPGYNPKDRSIITKKYSELFDGLIFIKNISTATYDMNRE